MKRTTLCLALTLVLPLGLACKPTGDSPSTATEAVELKTLSVDEVAAKIAAHDNKTFVFDNNGEARFKKGHVPGATRVAPTAVNASVLPPDKSATLVFYCANEQCSACHTGAKAALALGYTNVYIMPAGIQGWETAGKPLEVA